ncbi:MULTISPECIES: hypothetical protein [Roseivirga]|uniref:Uncharacterized protein n=1 Tax=Roseivirga spongicola TaxID=333140 RepID=A0A150X962_9BACT|nr:MULTISPECIES: hypothetical protein [Roseivirga]KYG75226.1 hypothetical protein AWW68_10490 [Roseivirga spongicola]MBO6661983.1 hypothetical protein [Roseivirga sp.]MBO6761463.1 hypothetical protein [Roseivirga sp.]MBO6909428.1 hypothetical protein [Roseivirga sp.]WPZ08585.1 hypothetical protein T7867_09955 [Roseivirga spongicola]
MRQSDYWEQFNQYLNEIGKKMGLVGLKTKDVEKSTGRWRNRDSCYRKDSKDRLREVHYGKNH